MFIKQCSWARESDWLILNQVTTPDPIRGIICPMRKHGQGRQAAWAYLKTELRLALERQKAHHYHHPAAPLAKHKAVTLNVNYAFIRW